MQWNPDSPQGAVLSYWFGDPPYQVQGKKWWQGGPELDAEIRDRFGALIEAALGGELTDWTDSPEGTLALVIVLDQFTRNAFRGSARAFAGDPRALQLVLDGLERGVDRQLHELGAAFFYMPLEHAESSTHQERCVSLFESLLQRCDPIYHDYLEGNLNYARRHRGIIRRFGRFPHRNAVMGRTSSRDEIDYLDSGGDTFGQ